MTAPITAISSMAVRHFIHDAVQAWLQSGGSAVTVESVGGVDAARRVREAEPFDLVVLASDAIDQLEEAGRVIAGSRVDLVRSGVVVGVRQGSERPAVHSEEALRQAVLASRAVGYSTGPSGTALQQLFARWGLADALQGRLVQARPGVPVGTLLVRGEVDLAFQQHSELMHLEGVDVLGPMPPGTEIVTVFSGGICSISSQPDGARALLHFFKSPVTDDAKRRHGLHSA